MCVDHVAHSHVRVHERACEHVRVCVRTQENESTGARKRESKKWRKGTGGRKEGCRLRLDPNPTRYTLHSDPTLNPEP